MSVPTTEAAFIAAFIFTARKRSLRRLCFYTCHSVHGGACMVARGGMCGCSGGGEHAWLLGGGMHGCLGGMHGCSGGACVVALGGGIWLLPGEACMVAWGACIVAPGGHVWLPGGAWLLQGGMHGCSWGGVHGIRRDTEIQSMSRRYASYWNAFLLSIMIICRSLLPTKIVRQKAKSNH